MQIFIRISIFCFLFIGISILESCDTCGKGGGRPDDIFIRYDYNSVYFELANNGIINTTERLEIIIAPIFIDVSDVYKKLTSSSSLLACSPVDPNFNYIAVHSIEDFIVKASPAFYSGDTQFSIMRTGRITNSLGEIDLGNGEIPQFTSDFMIYSLSDRPSQLDTDYTFDFTIVKSNSDTVRFTVEGIRWTE